MDVPYTLPGNVVLVLNHSEKEGLWRYIRLPHCLLQNRPLTLETVLVPLQTALCSLLGFGEVALNDSFDNDGRWLIRQPNRPGLKLPTLRSRLFSNI
nr:hypothetical protein CFP56_62202 [Quercus suber]